MTQPWASLVALGEKRIETRSWRTKYRGILAIHAAMGFPGWARLECFKPPFSTILASHDLSPDNVPRGRVICLTSLEDCVPTEEAREAWCYYSEMAHEERFGDYSDGRFAWILGTIRAVFEPGLYAKGHLGLWNWTSCFAVEPS